MATALKDLPDWPAGLTRDEALAFTRVNEAQMRAWERAGKVRFRAVGPNGAKIARADDLKAAFDELFATDAGEDMDFGD